MKEETNKKGKSSASRRVKLLQKQYNQILVDLVDKYAAESVEEALEGSEGSFGENITTIVTSALDILKQKVFDELGIKCCDDTSAGIEPVGVAFEVGAGDGIGLEDGIVDIEDEPHSDDETEEEHEEHEASETDEEEAAEHADGESEEDEDDKDKE